MISTDDPAGRFWRRSSALAVALVLARGVMYLCVLPPFEGWDEYQHVGYIEHIVETGRAPVFGEASVPRPVVDAAVALPHPERVAQTQLKAVGARGYASFWREREADAPQPAAAAGTTSPLPVPLYQAQHASFYYRLAAPLYSMLGGATNIRASVAGLRLANVGLTAATVALFLWTLRRTLRSSRDAALIGLVLASHPLFLINGARVANDALGVFLATAAVAIGLAVIVSDRDQLAWLAGATLGLGLVAGLAALAKATNYALAPFLAVVLLSVAVRHRAHPGRVAVAGLLMAVGFLGATQAEIRFNLGRFGSITPLQDAVVNRANGRTGADMLHAALAVNWPQVMRRLWVRDLFFVGGWSAVWTNYNAVRLYQLAVTLGLAGWSWRSLVPPRFGATGDGRDDARGVFASRWVPVAFLAVVASYSAGLGYHRVQSILAWGAPATAPWYACPALPWFLALAVAGGLAWTRHPRLAPIRALIPLLIVAAGLAAEPLAVWRNMTRVYSGGASGATALARLAWVQPPALGTATLVAAILAEVLLLLALWRVWRSTPSGSAATAEPFVG